MKNYEAYSSFTRPRFNYIFPKLYTCVIYANLCETQFFLYQQIPQTNNMLFSTNIHFSEKMMNYNNKNLFRDMFAEWERFKKYIDQAHSSCIFLDQKTLLNLKFEFFI